MVGERIKALWGDDSASQRYPSDPDGDDYRAPAKVEDPHTVRDHTTPTLWERIEANRWWFLTSAVLGVLMLAVGGIYFGRFFGTVLANPWVQRGAVGASIAGAFYWFGMSAQRSRLEEQDELTLYDPESGESTHFLGEYRRLEGSIHDVFVPVKGFRRLGHAAETYTVGELSQDLVHRHGHNADAEVKIGLHPGVTTVDATGRGRKIVQLTAGLEPDPFGRESNVEATLPDMAAQETVTDLKTELEKANKEIRDLEDKLDQAQRLRENAREAAQRRFEEVLGDAKQVTDIVEPFVTRRGTEPAGTSRNGTSTEAMEERLGLTDE